MTTVFVMIFNYTCIVQMSRYFLYSLDELETCFYISSNGSFRIFQLAIEFKVYGSLCWQCCISPFNVRSLAIIVYWGDIRDPSPEANSSLPFYHISFTWYTSCGLLCSSAFFCQISVRLVSLNSAAYKNPLRSNTTVS